jgi:hypothetical protein
MQGGTDESANCHTNRVYFNSGDPMDISTQLIV